MNKYVFYICLFCVSFMQIKANPVSFKFSGGTIENGELKSRMEENVSSLLSEIARAASKNSSLNLTNINMEDETKRRLNMLWNENIRFKCDKESIISKCLNDFQGFQLRNIPITILSPDSTYNGSLNRELTISLNKEGFITGVRFSLELNEDVARILYSPAAVADTRQRREILKWLEDYVSFYSERNIEALNKIYCDDALIITGSLVTSSNNEENESKYYSQDNKIEYKLSSLTKYINNLAKVFSKKEDINISIDNISVMMHGAVKNIYGLTFHQKLEAGEFSNEGWAFFMWDFREPGTPVISVRTWQPEQVVKRDGVMSLDDIFIP